MDTEMGGMGGWPVARRLNWIAASAFPLSDQSTAVVAAVGPLLTVSTLLLHIGPQQFNNTLVMMMLTHCL